MSRDILVCLLVGFLYSFTQLTNEPRVLNPASINHPPTHPKLLDTILTVKMIAHTFAALSLLSVASAHFELKYPTARGFNDDTEGTFPCGGFDTVQQQRSNFSISGGPIQLNMGHQQTNVAVYMAIGANPGSGFSVVAKQQLTIEVLGDFCLGSVSVPAGLNVSDGTPASIQVVTNDHAGGGLYQVS